MNLNASGWRRDMGQHKLGSIDLAIADIQSESDGESWGYGDPIVKIGEDKIKIGWRSELILNGGYLVTVSLTKADVAQLFTLLFGKTVDPQEMKKHGIDVDVKSLMATTLMKMPLGEVLSMVSGAAELGTPILESEVSIRTFNCLQDEGIKTYEELATRSQSEMLRIPNFGRRSLNELRELLHARELRFEGE